MVQSRPGGAGSGGSGGWFVCSRSTERAIFLVAALCAGAVMYTYAPRGGNSVGAGSVRGGDDSVTAHLSRRARADTDIVVEGDPSVATEVFGEVGEQGNADVRSAAPIAVVDPVVAVAPDAYGGGGADATNGDNVDVAGPRGETPALPTPDPVEPTPPSTPSPAPTPASQPTPAAVTAPSPKPTRPPRDPSWAPEQRPIPGESVMVGHAWDEITVHSMNPPPTVEEASSDPAVQEELRSRLVLGIGMGVSSGNTDVLNKGLVSLPVFNTLLPSFLRVATTTYIYRFYFAYDHGDPIYDEERWRGRIEAEFVRLIREEDATRPHGPGYVPGATVDATSIIATLHWVHCDYTKKPAWAHSDAIMAAFKEGADYAFRTNDDTRFPSQPDWADRFIADLRGRQYPNLGVVGPKCTAGANWILTHDFTHRTHAAIFGVHYPRSLPGWSSDDWITYMYDWYKMKVVREDVVVEHMLHGTRYNPEEQAKRLAALNQELMAGVDRIDAFTQAKWGVVLPHTVQQVTCC